MLKSSSVLQLNFCTKLKFSASISATSPSCNPLADRNPQQNVKNQKLKTKKMNQKKAYLWKLAIFLASNGMKMSGEELAEHLNRNNFLTSYGTEYQGGRGTYKLISETYHWLKDLGLQDEADKIAEAFVKPNGDFAY